MPKGAEVVIQNYCREDDVFISIKDNGPGICQSKASQIFEPFYTSKPQGTGLGLAVVKSVVSSHQGEITLLNTEGQGAHFAIRLPTATARADEFCQNSTEDVVQIEESADE